MRHSKSPAPRAVSSQYFTSLWLRMSSPSEWAWQTLLYKEKATLPLGRHFPMPGPARPWKMLVGGSSAWRYSPWFHCVSVALWITITELVEYKLCLIMFPPHIYINFPRSGTTNYSALCSWYGAWVECMKVCVNVHHWKLILKIILKT